MALPQFADTSDLHCVTTWSQHDMEWRGVAFLTLAELVRPKPEAAHVFFKGYDGYTTNNPLDALMDDVLANHYGFTAEELGSILNYDIKYRLGRSTEEEE